MDIEAADQEARRQLLREWVAEMGGHAAVVRLRKLSGGQASYLSQVMNGYSFGAKAARNMEIRLGMPPLTLERRSPSSGGAAHTLSHVAYTLPATLSWEALMQKTKLQAQALHAAYATLEPERAERARHLARAARDRRRAPSALPQVRQPIWLAYLELRRKV